MLALSDSNTICIAFFNDVTDRDSHFDHLDARTQCRVLSNRFAEVALSMQVRRQVRLPVLARRRLSLLLSSLSYPTTQRYRHLH